MPNRLKSIQHISNLFIAIVCSLVFMLLCVLLIIQLTLFNPKYMKQIIEKSNYTTHLTQEINQEIENLGLASNIPSGVLNNSVRKKIVEKNILDYFSSIYTGKNYSFRGIKELDNSIRIKVTNYADKTDSEISEINLMNLEKNAHQVVKKYIELPYLATYGKKMTDFQFVFFLLIGGTLVTMITLFWILLYLLKGYLHRLLRNISYLFVSTGLFLIMCSGVLIYFKVFERIAIMSKALYKFIYLYLVTFNSYFLYTGIFCIIVGICVAILSEKNRNYLIEKNRNYLIKKKLQERLN
ncbi:hypothetical protein [Carnobacterium maltaromaticum]|uniref:hypothetical protein n=1 Tax=Carnobacterium maltaromaticum TaxID=2751 RepID=UPI00295E7B30|nr:hypothetical protein [Carnobacterium maltaromaticum]